MRNQFDEPAMNQKFNQADGYNYDGHISLSELNSAERVISRLKHAALKDLTKMDCITAKDIHIASFNINDLVMHAQGILHDITRSDQIDALLSKVKIESHKIVVTERITNVLNRKIARIQHAALTRAKKDSSITEAKSMCNYAKININKAQDKSSLKEAYISGISAINGALSKYVIDSQMYIKHQLIALTTKIKQTISNQMELDQDIKNVAIQNINAIKDNAISQLMVNDNLIALKKIQLHSINKLMQISTGKSKILSLLMAFSHFIFSIKHLITNSSDISLNIKLHLGHRIDKYQKQVMTEFQFKDINEDILNVKECKLSCAILASISKMYQHEIAFQKLSLSLKQRNQFINYLKKITVKINYEFQNQRPKTSIIDDFGKKLRLLSSISKQKDVLIYKNHVKQYIYSVVSQIDQFPDLSNSDQRYLRDQIINFNRCIQRRNTIIKLSAVKQALDKLFNKQVKYIRNKSLTCKFNKVLTQIKFSYLSRHDRQNLLKRLIEIKKDHKLNYDNKQLQLNDLISLGLDLFKPNSRRRLTNLSEDVYRHSNPLDRSALRRKLDQNLFGFDQRINESADILETSHNEQLYENLVYDNLYRLIKYSYSDKSKAFSRLMARLETVHHRIDASILDPLFNQIVNDRVDRYFNRYLLEILHARGSKVIQLTLLRSHKDLENVFKWILSNMRSMYIEKCNQLVGDIRHQLMAYNPSERILAKIAIIKAQTVSQIHRAGALHKIEYAKQINERRLYNLNNYVIGTVDKTKRSGHQRIHHMILDTKKILNINDTQLVKSNLILINRIFMVANNTNYRINVGLDDNVDQECVNGHKMLDKVLRHGYLCRLSKIAHHSQLIINMMASISKKVKYRLNKRINRICVQTTKQIKKCDQTDLIRILKRGHGQILRIVQHTIYLDPLKKRTYMSLGKLINQIRACIKEFTQPNDGLKQLAYLDRVDNDIKYQLSISNHKNVVILYKKKKKQLNVLKLNIIHKSQLNRFVYFTHRMSKQIHQLSMLSSQEIVSINAKFNRYYHKIVYNINNSLNIKHCISSEHRGEGCLNRLFKHNKQLNDRKVKLFNRIKYDVNNSKDKIKNLRYLKREDKDSSYKLLNQTLQQSKQSVKNASSLNEMKKVKDKSFRMNQKVVDDVSSADVLLAAIQSANNRISNSTLGKHQKESTLQQIHQIIKKGVMDQIKDQSSNLKRNNARETQNHTPRYRTSKSDGTVKHTDDKHPAKVYSDGSSNPSSNGSLKKILGKLGKVF